MKHDWNRADMGPDYRQIGFFPKNQEERNPILQSIHYELFREEGKWKFEIHPEGSLEFKQAVEKVFDRIKLPFGYIYADWPHYGQKDFPQYIGKFRKVSIPRDIG